MEMLIGLFVILVIIGALIVGALGFTALIYLWWLVIPLVCGYFGGGIGFLFGLGLTAVIGLIVIACNQ